MAHIRGHIIKLSTDSFRNDQYFDDVNFSRYIFRVMDYHDERAMIESTDSVGYGNDILFLTEGPTLDHKGKGVTNAFDIILKPQGNYPHAVGWTINGKTNWLVYNANDQNHSNDIEHGH